MSYKATPIWISSIKFLVSSIMITVIVTAIFGVDITGLNIAASFELPIAKVIGIAVALFGTHVTYEDIQNDRFERDRDNNYTSSQYERRYGKK